METVEPRVPPVKKKPRREKRLNIMIMGSVGSVRSFKISKRILFWAALFLLLYIPFSLLMINRYFDLRYTYLKEIDDMSRLEKENVKNNKALLRSRQHIALLEEYIEYLEEPAKRPAQAGREEKSKGRAPDLGPENPGTVTQPEKGQTKPPDLVALSDLVIDREESRMTVNFKLVNTQPGEIAAGGYIHIIARNTGSTPPREWTYPQVKLVNGVPENFRRGQLFLIQRFKPILGKFTFSSKSDAPSMIQVLVYDQSGTIILDKEFEVRNEP
ncbi:MAG: hypothetical protein MUO52_19115 [Desulfobacterales bacterium]|nr:hypothetical protein [Desulfobacterales bacterium]